MTSLLSSLFLRFGKHVLEGHQRINSSAMPSAVFSSLVLANRLNGLRVNRSIKHL